MNRLLPILVLFSLIFAVPSSATVIWNGFPGQEDGFQRGDRIVPAHMNAIDTALDSIKSDVDGLTSGGGDAIRVNGSLPSGTNTNFDLAEGDGITITLTENDPAGVDKGTFSIDLVDAGSGLEFSTGELTLLTTCNDNEVLASTSGTWACAPVASGTNVNVDSGSVSNPNFNSTTPAAGAGVLNLDFVVSTSDVAVQLTFNDITDVGTLTEAVVIENTLDADGITVSSATGSLLFTLGNGTFGCVGGEGAISWDGTILEKCEGGAVSQLVDDREDPLYIDGAEVTDAEGADLRAGDGIVVTPATGVSPDTYTFDVDLNGTIDSVGDATSLSGLEITATNELALLQGCADGQILAWVESTGTWDCEARVTGASAVETDDNPGVTISNPVLTDTDTITVTDTAGTITFDVVPTQITQLGTLTAKLVTDETGIEFQAQTGVTDCSAFGGTNGGIFYDGDTNEFKKCQDGSISDLLSGVNTISGNLTVSGDTDTDTLGVGAATTTSGKAEIGGEADTVQLVVEGNSTQTSDLFRVDADGGTALVGVENDGLLKSQAIRDIDGCDDLYDDPSGSGPQTTGDPDGFCDSDGTTVNERLWEITEGGSFVAADFKLEQCIDIYDTPTNTSPQTSGSNGVGTSDGKCDFDITITSDTNLVFNDRNFDGTTGYNSADAAGTGLNTGGQKDRDAFISVQCNDENDSGINLTAGCSMSFQAGRQTNPWLRAYKTTLLPGGEFASDQEYAELNVELRNRGAFGGGSINMGQGAIEGAVKVLNVADASTVAIGNMTGRWNFVTDGTATITLSELDQTGRNACFFASASGSGVTINTDGTDPIVINGQSYTGGITSSGVIGEFVCLLSADPTTTNLTWYVLGQSGTWTGSN